LLLTAGLLPLTGLVICGLLARLIVTHWALTDLVPTRLIQTFWSLPSTSSSGLFCAYLRSQGTWYMITLSNTGLPAWLPKEGGSITIAIN
jgi:hypothetical protein